MLERNGASPLRRSKPNSLLRTRAGFCRFTTVAPLLAVALAFVSMGLAQQTKPPKKRGKSAAAPAALVAVPVPFLAGEILEYRVLFSKYAVNAAKIETTNNGLTSASVTVNVDPLAPAFFTSGVNAASGNIYIAAEHANGTPIGPAATIKNATPAEPGETIMLFATGFGPPTASGEVLAVAPAIVIDGISADVSFAGLVGPGLYQINVTVPSSVTLGQDVLVVGLSGNFETQPNAFLTIAAQ